MCFYSFHQLSLAPNTCKSSSVVWKFCGVGKVKKLCKTEIHSHPPILPIWRLFLKSVLVLCKQSWSIYGVMKAGHDCCKMPVKKNKKQQVYICIRYMCVCQNVLTEYYDICTVIILDIITLHDSQHCSWKVSCLVLWSQKRKKQSRKTGLPSCQRKLHKPHRSALWSIHYRCHSSQAEPSTQAIWESGEGFRSDHHSTKCDYVKCPVYSRNFNKAKSRERRRPLD